MYLGGLRTDSFVELVKKKEGFEILEMMPFRKRLVCVKRQIYISRILTKNSS